MPSAIRAIKQLVLSDAPAEFTILGGPYKGIKIFAGPINNQQLRFGLYEREIHRYLMRAARSARWCIDVGAGFGELSLFFCLRVCASPVFAIEPWSPDVLESKSLSMTRDRSIR
jgi:hypothetical protein